MQLMACSPQELLSIRGIEESVKEAPQLKIEIKEVLHAGVYTRIAIVPENVLLVGAFMKVPTTLVVVGRCAMTVNGGTSVADGIACFTSPPGRKTVFRTFVPTKLIMSFATKAETLEQARQEFTDDVLQGEELCQE